jgi:hypothetical protein
MTQHDDYVHPESGRSYREGDPALRFAKLTHGLARQCEEFLRHYYERLEDRDYLDQYVTWPSDPDRITRAMGATIDAIDSSYTEVSYDRTAWKYGLGKQDEEWHRRYGDV